MMTCNALSLPPLSGTLTAPAPSAPVVKTFNMLKILIKLICLSLPQQKLGSGSRKVGVKRAAIVSPPVVMRSVWTPLLRTMITLVGTKRPNSRDSCSLKTSTRLSAFLLVLKEKGVEKTNSQILTGNSKYLLLNI